MVACFQKSDGSHTQKEKLQHVIIVTCRYCFWKTRNRKLIGIDGTMAKRTLTNGVVARNRYTRVIRYTSVAICCSNITRNTQRSNIVIVRRSPRECVNFSRSAPTGYSSAKVVPLAFLSTRHRHAISRIFLNSSRGTSSPNTISRNTEICIGVCQFQSTRNRRLWKSSRED